MKIVKRDEVKQFLDKNENVAIVEVLATDAFAEGHLPNAINIPADKVKELAPTMLKDKAQPIVTYCLNTSCTASKTAAKALEDLGYTNVSAYEAGKEDWKSAGLPIIRGPAAKAA